MIVSDGALQYVPFGALPNPSAGRVGINKLRPLIADHEVVTLPSASVLATMRRELCDGDEYQLGSVPHHSLRHTRPA
ncbi:MAG: CHAT domain-containing protein [Blastocatellia bacterium]